MDPLLAATGANQMAAAYFYSGQYRKASEAFQKIAEEEESPWQDVAPYLVARACCEPACSMAIARHSEGKDRLLAILKDPDQVEWHEASLRLLHLWQARVEPQGRLAELGEELTQATKTT